MPDGTQVQFPDDMPQDKIRSLIQSKFPQESQGFLEKAHTYLDPVRVLAGKAGEVTPPNAVDYANAALMALPAGKGPIVAPTQTKLLQEGARGFETVRANNNVELAGSKLKPWVNNLKSYLERKGFTPNGAPDVHRFLENYGNGANKNMNAYLDLRDQLRKTAQDFTNPKESAAASEAIFRLDNMFDTTSHSNFSGGTPDQITQVRSLLKTARGNYAAGKRSQAITSRDLNAEIASEGANSGANYDNTARRAMGNMVKENVKTGRTIAQNSGFSPEEATKMRAISEGNRLVNSARNVGNMLGGGKGFGATLLGGAVGGGAAYATNDPWNALYGLAAPGVGIAAKAFENRLTQNAIRGLANEVRLRSPLGATATPGPYNQNALAIKLIGLMPWLAGNQ